MTTISQLPERLPRIYHVVFHDGEEVGRVRVDNIGVFDAAARRGSDDEYLDVSTEIPEMARWIYDWHRLAATRDIEVLDLKERRFLLEGAWVKRADVPNEHFIIHVRRIVQMADDSELGDDGW